ncbi:RpiB/LacA/LacB family sugar-phosphate isomerase [Bacillus sp. MMSF_3328]|uniref:RpiB/LacA/LacB family sugar-phosphate isomerase n=1 Tax=Bacillus sp. MMSF_3328 TaxID=3047080 RepID=UPI00273FBFE2|nr:RpiB/LacA/LacB family sugar-phosphate isomerase [Bacillus sp. MMSF_3328]
MHIAIGSDHCGFEMKIALLPFFKTIGCDVVDYGCYSGETVDFPDISSEICDAVRSGKSERGILFCGTGVGAAIASNKINGIRAAVCHDIHSAHQSVEHDNVNVMCIGAQIIGPWLAEDLIKSFVNAIFSPEEHLLRRVEKLEQLELRSSREFNAD